MKRLFLLTVLLCIITSTFGFSVDDIEYNVTSDLTVEVTSGSEKYSGEIVIPPSVLYDGKTYSVTSIGQEAFSWCSDLTSITIPNSVKSIEYEAFWGCSGLTSVTIGNSVTSIGDFAFNNCYGLTSMTIPNAVTNKFLYLYISYLCSVQVR